MLIDFKDKQSFACTLLMNELKKDMLSHAYLIDGNNSSDLGLFVKSFVKAILCPNKINDINSCDNCNICRLIDDNTYPEVKNIKPDGNYIKKGQLLELQHDFSKSSVYGNKLIYVIHDAEKMRPEAANSMLKFLEEPNSSIIAILLTNNFNNMMPTIVSRCQNVKLNNNNCEIEDNKLLDMSFKFLYAIETNGIDCICNEKDLWFSYVDSKNRDDVILVIDNMINLYYDMLKLFTDVNSVLKYELYRDSLINLSKDNDMNSIIEKIIFLIDVKDSVRFNVNINLLVDSIILGIGRSSYNENCWS